MAREPTARDGREQAIVREVLERIDESQEISQRQLASDLGIALGMANAYIKRCIRKGWIKVNEAPARRYRYYLTPKGFAEKSRLTAQYFSDSLRFFGRARQSYDALFAQLVRRGARRVVLCGADELTEIAALCALKHDVKVVGVLRGDGRDDPLAGLPAIGEASAGNVDYWVIASSSDAAPLYTRIGAAKGLDHVAYPELLRRVVGAAQ